MSILTTEFLMIYRTFNVSSILTVLKMGANLFFIFSYYNKSLSYLLENQKDLIPGFELCWVKQNSEIFPKKGKGGEQKSNSWLAQGLSRDGLASGQTARLWGTKGALYFLGVQMIKYLSAAGDWGSIPESGRPWRREWLPLQCSLPWEFMDRVAWWGHSPWGYKLRLTHTHKGSPQPLRPAFGTLTAIRYLLFFPQVQVQVWRKSFP